MLDILSRFQLQGSAVSCVPYGEGHINQTFLVETASSRRYILQKINTVIFRDVPALMRNIDLVTSYLRAQGLGSRETLRLVPAVDGAVYFSDASGAYRVYDFIEDSICLQRAETADDFMNSAVAFGRFQQQLKEFPAHELAETLPGFHDTRIRVQNLKNAVAEDKMNRARLVQAEIDFALEQSKYAGDMLCMLDKGELPLRVTHNDTKLNNVMLDAATRQPLCVIDLDTVMPGLSGNDFGDSIRFGASTGAEDETDLSKIEMSLDLFTAYSRGFLSACGQALTAAEIETLPLAARLMTYECGIRFLTDYLQGDTYFRIHRPNHNLDRARTQFKLVQDMLQKHDRMQKIIREVSSRSF